MKAYTMGSNSSILLQKEEINAIAIETGFSPNQIKRLYNRFTALDKDKAGYLTRNDLLRIPELHVNPLCDRIIEVLIDDHGKDGKLNFRQFAQVFSTFRREKNENNNLNSKENKLKFLFGIYDRDKDNKINKSELLGILKMLVGSNIPEEQMNAIAERTITELDENGDLVITFEEFCDTLKKIDVDEKMSMKFLT
ncbi:calcineurin B homologous 1 [Brachionus plicatilis]|uniref:Calcineurin B homologous 1 n=1 Tax=Brachionus plicatilis TaxID=10195 RepID=A0A3M7QQN9_BRAPC|nr:calcineurin B homologous 1 [Brachionus plicatilis]